jgi:integrase/recombinase XerD
MSYVDKALNLMQVELLLATASQNANPRNRAMLLVAIKHAMRPSEVVNLRLSDLDLKNGLVTISRLKKSEDNEQTLSASEREALAAWLAVRDDASDFLFTSRKGGRMDVSAYFRVYQAAAIAAELPASLQHPHCARHTAAVLMLNTGASLPEVQKFLGHKSLASTGHYLKVSDKQANAAAAKAFDTF